jgi:hypothetical protein
VLGRSRRGAHGMQQIAWQWGLKVSSEAPIGASEHKRSAQQHIFIHSLHFLFIHSLRVRAQLTHCSLRI